MLVESINVKNFKILGDFSVEGLRRVTLLGGDNGCGKTTLLEAVVLCCARHATSHKIVMPIFLPMRDNRLMFSPDMVENLFHQRDTSTVIKGECRASGVSLRATVELANELRNYTTKFLVGSADKNDIKPMSLTGNNPVQVSFFRDEKPEGRILLEIGGGEEGRAHMEKCRPSGIEVTFFRNGFLGDADTLNAENFSHLAIAGDKEVALSALNILVPKVRDISLAKIGQDSLVFVQMEGEKKQMPAAMLGGGACKLLSLVLALYANRDMLFLLDEVTVGWHHSHLVDLWKIIFRICKERNHQIIATTHSREGIAAFAQAAQDEEAQEDACYIRLDKWDEETDPKQKVTSATYDGKLLWSATHELEEEVR